MILNVTFKLQGVTYDVKADYTPVVQGKYSGPPEDCYPDEGGEVEILELVCDEETDFDALLSAGPMYDKLLEAIADACEAKLEQTTRMLPPPGYDY